MGPGFAILLWAILLTPVALLFGLPVSFLGPFVYYKLRRVPAEKRKRGWLFRIGLTVLFVVVFVPSICMLGLYLSFSGNDDYWNYSGAFDFWRMPLEPPYELVMIDTMDRASISTWSKGESQGQSLVWDIVKYEQCGQQIAGITEDRSLGPKGSQNWFLFDCATGKTTTFTDETLFGSSCLEKGFKTPLAMNSIQENWDTYWRDPSRRKK